MLRLSTKQHHVNLLNNILSPGPQKQKDHQAYANNKHGRKPMAIKKSTEVVWQRTD